MTVTPQSIRDSEFQVKLRGYDQAEVREYLERIAEEYLRLIEHLDKREQSVKVLSRDNNKLREKSTSWKQDIVDARKAVDEIKNDCRQEKEQCEKQKQELKTLRKTVSQLEGEKRTTIKKLIFADTHIKKLKAGILQEQSRKKKLLQRIVLLEKENKDLQKEDNELKKTLATAQKFSEGMIQESEKQASEVLNRARFEIDKLRCEAREELAHFPAEIKRMKEQHGKVKEQLRAIVNEYLESFEKSLAADGVLLAEKQDETAQDMTAFEEKPAAQEAQASVLDEEAEKEDNNFNQHEYRTIDELEGQDELFQSIRIPNDMPFNSDYLDEISKNISLPLDMKEK